MVLDIVGLLGCGRWIWVGCCFVEGVEWLVDLVDFWWNGAFLVDYRRIACRILFFVERLFDVLRKRPALW